MPVIQGLSGGDGDLKLPLEWFLAENFFCAARELLEVDFFKFVLADMFASRRICGLLSLAGVLGRLQHVDRGKERNTACIGADSTATNLYTVYAEFENSHLFNHA